MPMYQRLACWVTGHRWLVAILGLSLCLNTIGIEWGLPNGNDTWATDALQPLAPLAIVKRVFADEPRNSGWFYFKYPLGHPFVLAAVQLPYVAWLRATGEFTTPQSTYPYGFRHPERALTVLALLTRVVSVLMGVGVVGCAYVIAALLFGTSAGLVAAVLVAGCYPLVYFAHTSNVDVPMLFWTALTIVAALACADHGSRLAAVLAGLAAGMALGTKEQSLGVLVAVPPIWFLRSSMQGTLRWREAMKHIALAGVVFMAVTVLVGNLWWNPAGFSNRWRFLLGTLPADIREKYAPYQFFLQQPTVYSLSNEVEHLLDVTEKVVQGLTAPVALLCLVGVGWAVWYRPRQAVLPLLPAASYYLFSLRAIPILNVKYTIPLQYLLLILGGAAGGVFLNRSRQLSHVAARRATILVMAVALGGALVPGIDLDRLMINDPRYTAEAWLRMHVPASARVETYQSPTRLPRFMPDIQVSQVPMEERTVALFAQRQPDFVVLSSGGNVGLTYDKVTDWEPGEPVFIHLEAAQEFFDRLQAEELGYRRVAQFHTPLRWITPPFGSVNPKITILARHGFGALGSDNGKPAAK